METSLSGIACLLVIRQGVTGRNTCNWPVSFPSKCLMAFAQFTAQNDNDDMWNNDVIMYFSRDTVRCGGEGRYFYHIGIGC